MGRRKTINKQYIRQTKCPWRSEWRNCSISIQGNFSAIQRNELRHATTRYLHKHDGECKKPNTEQYRMILFTRNSRKVKSVAVEGRWVIAGDGSQKETWGDGNALYLERYGSSIQSVSVRYLHLKCCGGGYTGVHTFLETHKSVHLKCVHYRDVPGDLVVKTSRFQCRGLRLDPWSGNQDPTGHGTQPKNKKMVFDVILYYV